jgi:hypothetical protein
MSIAVGLAGEGYGNFGLLGVVLWVILMGVGCRRGDDYFGNFHQAHPLRLQLAAMAGVWAALIVRGGVPEMFYMGLTLVLCPLGLALYLAKREVPLEAARSAPARAAYVPFGAPPAAHRPV